jgi:hypothetical protein
MESDPVLKRLDEWDASMDLRAWALKLKQEVDRYMQALPGILGRMGDVPDMMGERMMLQITVRELDVSLEPLRHFAATGEYDLNTFLDNVLKKA